MPAFKIRFYDNVVQSSILQAFITAPLFSGTQLNRGSVVLGLFFCLAEMTWLAPFQGTYTSVVVARECLGSCVSCIMATNEERNEALAIKKSTTSTASRRSRAFFTRGDSFQRFSAAVASAAASVSHSFNPPTQPGNCNSASGKLSFQSALFSCNDSLWALALILCYSWLINESDTMH